MMMTLDDVSKTYHTSAGAFDALRSVDLTIDRGELVAVTGKSGSGKSTLLNLIGAIDRPSSGRVVIGETEVHLLPERELGRWRGLTLGFVFQFFQLLPTLTAAENVMLPMDFCRSYPASKRRSRAIELLERVGVADQADKIPATLSGGQQQRVAIARALANDPIVILADEPTGNLDSVTAAEMIALLRETATAGTTVVIATHDTDIALVADREVMLRDGVLVDDDGSGLRYVEEAGR